MQDHYKTDELHSGFRTVAFDVWSAASASDRGRLIAGHGGPRAADQQPHPLMVAKRAPCLLRNQHTFAFYEAYRDLYEPWTEQPGPAVGRMLYVPQRSDRSVQSDGGPAQIMVTEMYEMNTGPNTGPIAAGVSGQAAGVSGQAVLQSWPLGNTAFCWTRNGQLTVSRNDLPDTMFKLKLDWGVLPDCLPGHPHWKYVPGHDPKLASYGTPSDKIWRIKKLIRENTDIKCVCNTITQTTQSKLVLPEGFSVWQLNTQPSITEVEEALRELFAHLHEANAWMQEQAKSEEDFECKYTSRGLTYFPSNDTKEFIMHGQAVSVHNFREMLHTHYPVIDSFWANYERAICARLCVDQKHLEDSGVLTLIRYDPKFGIWMHLDNLNRSDATAFTVGVGRECVYDMAPVLAHLNDRDANSMMRVRFPKGALAVMDGRSRYQWSHGVPYGMDGVKYTFVFKLQNTENHRCIGTDPTIGCKMYAYDQFSGVGTDA